ncbi:MAG: hypothetical protein KAG66_04725 [Methylococcales bacterium]|nr:hypothetical protein [Methylococcales bacterium]
MSSICMVGCPSTTEIDCRVNTTIVDSLDGYHTSYANIIVRYTNTVKSLDNIKCMMEMADEDADIDIRVIQTLLDDYTSSAKHLRAAGCEFVSTFTSSATGHIGYCRDITNVFTRSLEALTGLVTVVEDIIGELYAAVYPACAGSNSVNILRPTGFAIDYAVIVSDVISKYTAKGQ